MEQIDEFQYVKLNYLDYLKRINQLLKDERLLALGIKKTCLGKTYYGYDIDCITIGYGTNDLFLVGGIHGSEVIGVDFILNFIKNIPHMINFDPNLCRLVIIPLQNPEGFDISSSTFYPVLNKFHEQSYEYYLRYRIDSIISYMIQDFNDTIVQLKQNNLLLDANTCLRYLQKFFLENRYFQKLKDERAIPKVSIFQEFINQVYSVNDYYDLKIQLLEICDKTSLFIDDSYLQDWFLSLFLSQFQCLVINDRLWNGISLNHREKLYQKMFENRTFDQLYSSQLPHDVYAMYEKYHHPRGSQVGHDSTGIGINLNSNSPFNPGIDTIKNGKIVYGYSTRDNIQKYCPGPYGVPTLDVNNFTYAIENQVLEELIRHSVDSDRYLATLLYHGTGGMIFYKPYGNLMKNDKYLSIYSYNEELAVLYGKNTDYQLLNECNIIAYDDYLRLNYPGVLLIELSKMGGNPIGPYGDKNNIYQVFHDNVRAIDSWLEFFFKKCSHTKVLSNNIPHIEKR